jgi:hypothetical protein
MVDDLKGGAKPAEAKAKAKGGSVY